MKPRKKKEPDVTVDAAVHDAMKEIIARDEGTAAPLDFEGAADSAPKSKEGLAKINMLVGECEDIDKQTETLEGMIKSLNARYNFIRTNLIPDVMAELGTKKWTNDKGTTVEVGSFVSGSIPSKEKEPEKHKAAMDWVETNAPELPKTVITLEFGKSQHNVALSLAYDLKHEGYNVDISSGVHASTLQAYAREALKSGREDFPLETLGLFSGRYAEIKKARAKKTKETQS